MNGSLNDFEYKLRVSHIMSPVRFYQPNHVKIVAFELKY